MQSLHNTWHRPRNKFLLFLVIPFLSWILLGLIQVNHADAKQTQEGIAGEVIRFHVIANSDSTEDQQLKLKVKDQLVKQLSPLLKTTPDIKDARAIILGQLENIKETAQEVILANGYHYSVHVSLENCYFPIKVYGAYTFPAGTYEALRVRIGEAEGQNWWCVMFPPLCFVDETYSIVDQNTDQQLKHLLTEDEYDSIKNKVPIKVKFKIFDSIKKLFNHELY